MIEKKIKEFDEIGYTILENVIPANKVQKINKINSDSLDGIKFTHNSENEIIVSYEKDKHKIDEIINKVKEAGMEIYDISTNEGNLEDVFVDLTKS